VAFTSKYSRENLDEGITIVEQEARLVESSLRHLDANFFKACVTLNSPPTKQQGNQRGHESCKKCRSEKSVPCEILFSTIELRVSWL
jgi:hypothetical protein